jgi:myo-inositol-1(or 4)-monophosphatase
MPSISDFAEYRDFAIGLAKDCGDIARRHFNPDIRFEPKGDNSPVTAADLEINHYVIERCQQAYPTIGIMGEEESSAGSDANLLWVCDPIDGTSPYAFGMSASTFCLALVEDGRPVVGIVYDFMNQRLFHAVVGQGAFLNGEPVVRPDFAPMKLVNYEWWSVAAVEIHGFHEYMFARGFQVPNYTSSGFMGLQVASGRIAGQVYAGISPWDAAALKVIAEECGCVVRNLDGEEQRYDRPIKGAITARADYFDEILAAVKATT